MTSPSEPDVPASEPQVEPPDLHVDFEIEAGAFPIIRARPRASIFRRPSRLGPFRGHEDLLDELLCAVKTRTLLADARQLGGRRGTWHLTIMALPSDVEPVRAGLHALLDDGDAEPLREFIRHPPPLPVRRWESPTPGEGWIGR